MKKTLIALTLTSLSFAGILEAQEPENKKNKAPAQKTTIKPYLKLKKGATWTYEVRLDIPESHELTNSVSKAVEIKDGRAFHQFEEDRVYTGKNTIAGHAAPVDVMLIYLDNKKFIREAQYLLIHDQGILGMGVSKIGPSGKAQNLMFSTPMPIIFKDAQPGTEWEWNTPDFKFTFRVIGIEKVKVPAGEFSARQVQVTEKVKGALVAKRSYWYADEIGIIKETDERYPAKGLVIKRSTMLKSFELENPEKLDQPVQANPE